MRKKSLLIFVIMTLLIAGIWWWWGSPYSDPAKKDLVEGITPDLKIASMVISEIDEARIKVDSRIVLHNPFPVEINTGKLHYEIFIDSIMVIQNDYDNEIRINSSDSTVVEIPMEILTEPMINILKYFDDNNIDSASYTMEATLEVDVPIAGDKEFSMVFTRKLPALLIPEIKFESIDLNILNSKEEGVDMLIRIINPNLFPIKIDEGTFTFKIDEGIEMDGILDDRVEIAAKSSEVIAMHADIKQGSLPKAGWQYLTNKKGSGFAYVFNGRLNSENKMLDNSKTQLRVEGTLAEFVEFIDKAKK